MTKVETGASPAQTGWRGLAALENIVVCLALLAMTLVPLAEAVLRRVAGIGIKGASSIVQQLCLIVGMAGAVIAARQNRLLALSTLGRSFKGRFAEIAHFFAAVTAVAISASLGAGSAAFVSAERAAGDAGAATVAAGLL